DCLGGVEPDPHARGKACRSTVLEQSALDRDASLDSVGLALERCEEAVSRAGPAAIGSPASPRAFPRLGVPTPGTASTRSKAGGAVRFSSPACRSFPA